MQLQTSTIKKIFYEMNCIMGICSWVMNRLYNHETQPKEIQTAIMILPYIPKFSEESSVLIIQKYTKIWFYKRKYAAIKIQRKYESKILSEYKKYSNLEQRILLRKSSKKKTRKSEE